MAGNIYLIQNDKTLQPMTEQPYAGEDDLQQLLEKYPELLAGEQMDSAVPRRLILISREIGVPGEEDGFDRWSLDHLFIDQDGIPTLVEVKQSTDTRIRREVVGQMLDMRRMRLFIGLLKSCEQNSKRSARPSGI